MAENKAYKKSSFGPAFLFLSKRRRTALANYYAFCRLMDDLADEPTVQDRTGLLTFWQAEVDRIFDGKAQTALGQQLTADVREFNISKDRFLLLIEGMLADVAGKKYATLEALEWYLYRVAVVVGLATLDILGVKGPQAEKLAKNLGGAVQLTNIIRDVTADAALGRVYLPEDLLTQAGLTREAILAGNAAEKTAPVLEKLAHVARQLYKRAEMQMRRLPRLKMLPCRMMGCVYAQNLAKIERGGFVVQAPIKLSRAEKGKGVLDALRKTICN